MIQTDKINLRTLLFCLLENAVTFTFSGAIRIAIHLKNPQPPNSDSQRRYLRFVIEDTGNGFSLEERMNFNRYLNNLDNFKLLNK